MRKLIILRGAMGCGKTTFIKEHHLERFTLSSDTIRLMFSSPELTINYTETIPQYNNKKVWDLLYQLLEERMKKGEFTIIDAVHAYVDESFKVYKKLAEKYRYHTYVLDFTDIPKEEVLKRNLQREDFRIVPPSSIERVYTAFKKEKIPSSFRIIKPEDFETIIKTTPRDLNNYENIHIIGDIHGSYTALKTYFNKYPIIPQDFYIFVGDYFDRGIENYQTFKYLKELMEQKNMIFLVGNHEDKLYKYACDDEFKMDYDIKNTIEEFEQKELKKSEIRGFIKKLSQLAYITFNGKSYLITHGGIPYIPEKPLDFYSTNTFIYGIDKYDVDIDKIYNEYMKSQKEKTYQIHGHRNHLKLPYNTYIYSINLEGDIEHGGHLRVLTLTKNDSQKYTEIKNNNYNPNLITETATYNLVEDLRKNKYIFEKELEKNLSSFNFSKEAFYNKIWNNITTQARGLFIDTAKYHIVARSYNKFFKIEERPETKLENLKKSMIFPAHFYLKYNGFLGIISVWNDELFFASKKVNTGNYVEYFKTIFYNKLTPTKIKKLKQKLAKENLTAVFEVIDSLNDPHIIEYQESDIILLDFIHNTPDFSKLPYEELQKFATENNIKIKELAYTAKTYEELEDILKETTQENYQWKNNNIEGFVIEDSNFTMLKTKTHYYDTWKYLRAKMETALTTNKFKIKEENPLEKNFMTYLKETYQNKDIDITNINIIEVRKNFLKEQIKK